MYDGFVLFCPHAEIPRNNSTRTEVDGKPVTIRFCAMCEGRLYGQKQPIRVKDGNTGEEWRVEHAETSPSGNGGNTVDHS